jgi:hypothetical protein
LSVSGDALREERELRENENFKGGKVSRNPPNKIHQKKIIESQETSQKQNIKKFSLQK